jgi:hypothetical protein
MSPERDSGAACSAPGHQLDDSVPNCRELAGVAEGAVLAPNLATPGGLTPSGNGGSDDHPAGVSAVPAELAPTEGAAAYRVGSKAGGRGTEPIPSEAPMPADDEAAWLALPPALA